MPSINTIISNISNQNISLFFENKITSFKPEKDVFTNTVNEETAYSDPIKIGHAELKNHEELLVFTCEYNKELTARSAKKQQFEIAKKVLKEDFKDGAIFIFYDKQGNFRFSFIRRNYGETGNKKFSTWKRYTYYVTPSETNRTFKERIDKCDYTSLDSIQEAFSVEKLTKQFYNELFAWYQWALSDEIGITYPNNTSTSDDDRVKLEEQVIRLITRLLFVWFIKQKKLVPEYLFNTTELENTLKDFDCNSIENGNYYNAILQNLFFATLNKEISEREFAKTKNRDIKTRFRYEDMFTLSEAEIIEYFKPIPFLNGGLFECLDKQDADGNSYFLDGFSRNPTKSANGNFRHRAFIPNCLFFDEEKGIIPLLRRYNFTVEENAPNEVQVALDPELLGKVFENLLGAFNPETKETARKQSGSFYTPREIVEYMVNESLINYLQTKLPNLDEKDLRDLFENETPNSTFLNDIEQSKEIANQLKAIKILDPACGSGAFPMGILSKMVEVLEKLGATNESIHDLKLHLIEECIYGIDIQTIATQISKLRFFITLVVEQQAIDLSKPDDNYGVLTLPNLETKFVSANTLIGIKKKKAGDFVNTLFTDSAIDDTKQELLSIRHEHFYAKTAGAKKRLREQDALLRDKLSILLEENKDFAPDDALQLSQWNPYDQNTSSSFFDMEWMFGIKDGFDVVIGNPPYVEAKKLKEIAVNLRDYEVYSGTADLSSYFFEKGTKLCCEKGHLCYINTNKFFNTGYGKKVRQYLLNKNLKQILNFEQVEVFEGILVSSVIVLLQNTKSQKDSLIYTGFYKLKNKVFRQEFLNVNKLVKPYQKKYLTEDEWSFADESELMLKERIEAISDDLINFEGVQVYRGITTGYNPAFIIDSDKKKDLISSNRNNSTLIHPLLQGRNIRKWSYLDNDEYIIFTKQSVDIENYPEVKEYLFEFYSELKPRNNNEKIGRKPGSYKWYEIQDNTAYYAEFEQSEKIIWGLTADKWAFAYDDQQHYLPSNGYILTSTIVSVKFLLGLLNSNVLKFYFKFIGIMTAGGAYTLKHGTIKKLPIPIEGKENSIETVVNEILERKKNNESIDLLEVKLNIEVYKIYKLNYQEVLIIDPEFNLTQEEYDNYKI